MKGFVQASGAGGCICYNKGMSKKRTQKNREAAKRRRARQQKLEQQRAREKRRRMKRLRAGFVLLLVFGLLFFAVRAFITDRADGPDARAESYAESEEPAADPVEDFPEAETEAASAVEDTEEADTEEVDVPRGWDFNENLAKRRVQSDVALLYNLDTDEIIYEKNADKLSYPASLTKIMTQYAALQMASPAQLEEEVSISEETYRQMITEDASMSGFAPGEPITFQDMLYANFLASGGDASETIGIVLSGSVEAFVEEMNLQAQRLGMNDTVFKNPTGLHDEEHRTTAHDLLKLTLAALKEEDFLEYFTAYTYETEPLDENADEGHVITARLWENLQDRSIPYKVLGGKTGFTEEAGLCLITVMERSGSRFLIITMGAPYEVSRTTDLDDHQWLMRGLTREN